MKNWNINNRVLFITLFPLVIITLSLNTYFTVIRFADMQNSILKQGNALAFQLAAASEYGVISGNTEYLEKLTKTALSTSEILKITIIDSNNEPLVSDSKNEAQLKSPGKIFDFIYQLISAKNESLKFSQQIISEGINTEDYPEDELTAGTGSTENSVIGNIELFISLKLSTYNQVISIIKGNLILLLIFLFAFYLALRLTGDISRSIINIFQAVKRIESGDLFARVVINSGGEIGKLSKSVNHMADALQDSDMNLRREIDKATSNLRNSYIEIEKQNKRLIQARSAADAANQAKSSFLANISHEIRTPINGVVGFTEVLLKTHLTTQQIEYVKTIKTASDGLMHLINDLLDFARIESGKMVIESVNFDIRSVLENIHTIYSNNAYKKGVEFLTNIDEKLPNKLISDPVRIEQIFINLVSNAIKFTNSGDIRVDICLHSSSYDHLELKCSVTDTGIGLTASEIERIFHEFEQADKSTSRKYGGTGLGLAITKNIIELLGGKIHVESNKGKGSTFWFTIKCGYSDQEMDFFSHTYNDRTLYYIDTYQESDNIYSKLLKSIGFDLVHVTNPSDIIIKPDDKSIFIYSIDARYNISKNFDNLLNGYKNISIDKVAFISSNNPDIHDELRKVGFDFVISKTINRTQLLNSFSTTLLSKESISKAEFTHKDENKKQDRLNILIVDDNEINVKILEAYLKPTNLNTFTANNGEDALTQLNENEIALIFMDIHMPVLNGYKTTQIIRSSTNSNTNIPIIGITADGLQKTIEKCIESGMDQCLVKPITYSDIEKILDTFIFSKNQSLVKPALKIDTTPDQLTLMMINELPSYKEQLKISINKKDNGTIYQIAHKIAGGSAYCNLPNLRCDSLNLQSAAKNSDIKNIEKCVEQLITTMDELIHKNSIKKTGS